MESAAPLTLMTDPELLTDWLEHGREGAFHALVSRYAVLVRMAALRSGGGDEVLAAEAAQLTFILLARKARALSARKSLAGWLHLTALLQVKNLVRQHRRESRKRLHLRASMENDPDSTTVPPPDHAAAWRELSPVLDKALAGLPDKYREPLLLRFYRSLSVAEIAATLGIATAAAQKRLDRATAKLRARLVRLGCAGFSRDGLPGPALAVAPQNGAALHGASLTGLPLTSTSLAAVLLAGFAADSHAAAIASSTAAATAASGTAAGTATAAGVITGSGSATALLAAKALSSVSTSATATAAAAVGGSGLSHLLTRIAALKTSALLPPAIALLLAAAWLTPEYRALVSFEADNHALGLQLAAARRKAETSAADPSRTPLPRTAAAATNAPDSGTLNWKELAALFAEDPAAYSDLGRSARRTRAELLIKQRVPLMSKEELADALDEVIVFSESTGANNTGRLFTPLDLLTNQLIAKDPQFALSKFTRPAAGGSALGIVLSKLSDAFGEWVKTDPGTAVRWFDQQIASGVFESKRLNGEILGRVLFESELIGEMFRSQPENAAPRLQALTEGQRKVVLYNNSSLITEAERDRFLELARGLLDPENEAAVIARLAMHQHDRERRKAPEGSSSFAGMETIMDTLQVTPQERASCARALAESEISARVFRDGVKVPDLDAYRPWLKAQAPAEADRITGALLAGIAGRQNQISFEETAALASRYDEESGGQEVLTAFLEDDDTAEKKTEARKLVVMIRDQTRRERILKALE